MRRTQRLLSAICIRFVVSLAVAAVALLTAANTHAYDAYNMPKNLKQGWDGDIQLGALASFGPTDSSSISARTVFSYRNERWEHELEAKLYRSASEAFVTRRDSDGEVSLDVNNNEIEDLVRSTTNDRRYISAQGRWFYAPRYYVFGIADRDVNKPANLESSTRQIAGVGYKLYRSKTDFFSAAVGAGHKQRTEVSGSHEQGGIGYFGLRFKRKIGEQIVFGFDLDSDFGSESRYSEAETSLSWKLRDPVSIKLKYELQFNRAVFDPLNTFDDGFESALSVNLAVELF